MLRSALSFVAFAIPAIVLPGGARGEQSCTAPAVLRSRPQSVNQFGALGDWYLEHRQFQCATETFSRGVHAYPDAAPLHYELGLALLNTGKATTASAEMLETIRLDPHFDRAFLVLGTLAHDRGDREEALRRWQQAAQINPESVTALDWIAKTRIEAAQFTEAMDLLATAPESEDLAIDYLLAAQKASLQEQGIASSERSLNKHPAWNRLRVALATVLAEANRNEDALALLRQAMKDNPERTDLQALTLRVLLLSGDTEGAKPVAERLLRTEPDSFDSLYLSGLLDRETGQFTEALPLLQKATRLQPNHFDARFNLGIVYAKLHRMEEAKGELLQAEKLPGRSPEVHFQLASVLRATGDAAGAEAERKLYQNELAARAQHDELVSLSAQAAQKLQAGDARGAADVERSILGKFPDQAVHWYDLALALDALGDLGGEVTALEHAVQLRPEFARAWNQLGYLRARQGDAKGAETAFRAAIGSAPQYAEAQNNLGSLLAQTGRDGEAQPFFRAAVAANPRLVDGWVNLAASLAATGEFSQARAAAQSALALQPGNSEVQRLMAMLNDRTAAFGARDAN